MRPTVRFSAMTAHPALLSLLAKDGVRHRFRRGEAMFSQGDFADRVFLIEQGWVKISHASPDGRETVLGLRGPGEVVGELSTVDRAPRSAAAVTLGDVEVLVVPGRVLEQALQADAAAALELLRIVAGRLRDADVKRVEFSSLSTVGRVASRLVELAERFGTPTADGVEVELPLSQEELAAWCGSSREATVKALRALRAAGAVTTGRRTAVIPDLDALRRHATPRG